MGRAQTGIHQDKQDFWCVDRIYKGTRLRNRFQSFEEAESWLIFQLEQLRKLHLFGVRPKKIYDEAAAKYLLDHQEKVSLLQDIYLLERLVPFIGKLTWIRFTMERWHPISRIGRTKDWHIKPLTWGLD